MSSYKQLSNQGTLLLGTGASVSADKRRPISQPCNQHRTQSPPLPLATAHCYLKVEQKQVEQEQKEQELAEQRGRKVHKLTASVAV